MCDYANDYENYANDKDSAQKSKQPTIEIKNTRFIYRTNFSGDPKRDNFGNDKRHANLVIPDAQFAQNLILDGFNVKNTYEDKKQAASGTPTFFIDIKVNYDFWVPPNIYLVTGGKKILLDENTVCKLDHIYVQNVDAYLSAVINRNDKNQKTLYVRAMYVTQLVDDPFAEKYSDYELAQDVPDASADAEEPREEDNAAEQQDGFTDPGSSDYYGELPFK